MTTALLKTGQQQTIKPNKNRGTSMINVLEKEKVKADSFAPDATEAQKVEETLRKATTENRKLRAEAEQIEQKMLETKKNIALPLEEARIKLLDFDLLLQRNLILQAASQDRIDEIQRQLTTAIQGAHAAAAAVFEKACLDAAERELAALERVAAIEEEIRQLGIIATLHKFRRPPFFFDRSNSFLNMKRTHSDLSRFKLKERLDSFREVIESDKNNLRGEL